MQAQAGHRSIESARVYLYLASDWLATGYRRAAALTVSRGQDGSEPDFPSGFGAVNSTRRTAWR